MTHCAADQSSWGVAALGFNRTSGVHSSKCRRFPIIPLGTSTFEASLASPLAKAHAVDGRQIIGDGLPVIAAILTDIEVARGAAKRHTIAADR